jgi:hypothetical protein
MKASWISWRIAGCGTGRTAPVVRSTDGLRLLGTCGGNSADRGLSSSWSCRITGSCRSVAKSTATRPSAPKGIRSPRRDAARHDDQASQPPPSPRSARPAGKRLVLPGAMKLLLEVGKSLPADWQRPRTLPPTLATGSVRSNRQKDRARWPPRHRSRAGRQPRWTWPALLEDAVRVYRPAS